MNTHMILPDITGQAKGHEQWQGKPCQVLERKQYTYTHNKTKATCQRDVCKVLVSGKYVTWISTNLLQPITEGDTSHA